MQTPEKRAREIATHFKGKPLICTCWNANGEEITTRQTARATGETVQRWGQPHIKLNNGAVLRPELCHLPGQQAPAQIRGSLENGYNAARYHVAGEEESARADAMAALQQGLKARAAEIEAIANGITF